MEIVRAKDHSVVFLADILTEEARLEFIQNSIIFYHRWVVPRVGRSGGLVLYWRSSIYLKIKGSTKIILMQLLTKIWKVSGV